MSFVFAHKNIAKPAEPNSRLYLLQRFYYDTAQSANTVQLQALKTLVGVPHIIFGSDYPFGASAGRHLKGLAKCGFNAEELRAIQYENAVKILPRFAS